MNFIIFLPLTHKDVTHDDVIKWKPFPRYWPFVRGIHRPSVNSPHKGQWRRALMFSLICIWINGWVNNRKAGDLRRYRAHYEVTVMLWPLVSSYPGSLDWTESTRDDVHFKQTTKLTLCVSTIVQKNIWRACCQSLWSNPTWYTLMIYEINISR